jgi:predicted thioesterase
MSLESKIAVGKTGTARAVVSGANTAKAVGSGSLEVFGTPMLVALMEQAACACLEGALEAGQTSVGTLANIAHTVASPLGAEVVATAAVTAVEGRKVSFAVSARDGKGEVGGGTHERFVVDERRFMGKLLNA